MQPGQPTYEVQWQKITSAYLNDELEPWNNCACFIGNLLGGGFWSLCRRGEAYKGEGYLNEFNLSYVQDSVDFIANVSYGLYSAEQIVELENNFLKTIWSICEFSDKDEIDELKFHYRFEAALYEAMTSTLELLRQIHLKHNDETAIEIPLKKRELCA